MQHTDQTNALRADPVYKAVTAKIQAVASGRVSPANLPGPIAVRLAVGLALDCLSSASPTGNGERADTWRYMTPAQRQAIADYNPTYRGREWENVPVNYDLQTGESAA